jgi:hypothetical protein
MTMSALFTDATEKELTRCTAPPFYAILFHTIQLINNAGYFYEPVEKLDSLNFDEELKMIDICALGPMRISAALVNGGFMKKGSKIIMITSQGGSVGWRTTQNPDGEDYGHHVRIVSQTTGKETGWQMYDVVQYLTDLNCFVVVFIYYTDVQMRRQHVVGALVTRTQEKGHCRWYPSPWFQQD